MGTAGLRQWAIVAIAAGVGAGCGVDAVFACQSDDQCGGEGRCELAGVCSFPDWDVPIRLPLWRSRRRSVGHVRRAGDRRDGRGERSAPDHRAGRAPRPPIRSRPVHRRRRIRWPSPAARGGEGTSTGDGSSSTTSETIPRVDDGILVLYTFKDGSGDIVADVSAVDPPLDLTLQGDAAFDWNEAGLAKVGTGDRDPRRFGDEGPQRLHGHQRADARGVGDVVLARPDRAGPHRDLLAGHDGAQLHAGGGDGPRAEDGAARGTAVAFARPTRRSTASRT